MNLFRLFAGLLCFLSWLSSAGQPATIPGDYADPSIIKIGDSYYSSATSSNWMPAFPILKSTDLKTWQLVANVFPTLPDWADYYFWAPEISYENGKVYVYYAAHKRGRNLCVGVASADKPEGPYKDHGPLVCESDGSIDAFPMRDENGKLHLIWKEDANSIKQPTPIWLQEMNEERTALLGTKTELFRNDAPWENNLVEGVSVVKHGDYFYALYSASGCCGQGCSYKTGVARAKKLAGPWEKYANNPILQDTDAWKCPGHGTVVQEKNRFYFMYHAYSQKGGVFIGRQGLVREFEFTPDGWIKFTDTYVHKDHDKQRTWKDSFDGTSIGLSWNWSVRQHPAIEVKEGKLWLSSPDNTPTYICQRVQSETYQASVQIQRTGQMNCSGIGIIGDEKNLITAVASSDSIKIISIKKGVQTPLQAIALSKQVKQLYLKVHVKENNQLSFSYSQDGKTYTRLSASGINGNFLPPWDRAVRVGIVYIGMGSRESKAILDNFVLTDQ